MSAELHIPVPRQYFAAPAIAQLPPDNSFPTPTDILQGIVDDDNAKARDKKRVRRRRATQEAVARGLGYMPTDPDSLSSHDKKRLYLDCLEQYVVHLHTYMVDNGVQPVPIERVSSGRGLTSRSIRTLLVHLQSQASHLHLQRQDADLQREDMRAFYANQLALHTDGSGHDYTPPSGLPSASTPTPTKPHSADPPTEYPIYINTEGCYNVSPVESTGYNPYAVGGDLSSPQSPYGSEHAPNSYIVNTPTPIPSGLTAPAPSNHNAGPVPPTFGPGPVPSDPSSAFSQQFQQILAQRRHSIATTAAASYYASQAQQQAHTPVPSNFNHLHQYQHQHVNVVNQNNSCNDYYSGGAQAPNTNAYAGNTYIDSNGVYTPQTYQAMYSPTQQTSPQHQEVYASGVVVPSNAPPVSHIHTNNYGVGVGGAPAQTEPMGSLCPPQAYHFP